MSIAIWCWTRATMAAIPNMSIPRNIPSAILARIPMLPRTPCAVGTRHRFVPAASPLGNPTCPIGTAPATRYKRERVCWTMATSFAPCRCTRADRGVIFCILIKRWRSTMSIVDCVRPMPFPRVTKMIQQHRVALTRAIWCHLRPSETRAATVAWRRGPPSWSVCSWCRFSLCPSFCGCGAVSVECCNSNCKRATTLFTRTRRNCPP
mmetsp:Transcript_13714/g.37938  ORF Transcript_13714/g.37938 Transcript_13714/m.37938 type:complete len:207 (+) Transcript_13714:924-1544(+)